MASSDRTPPLSSSTDAFASTVIFEVVFDVLALRRAEHRAKWISQLTIEITETIRRDVAMDLSTAAPHLMRMTMPIHHAHATLTQRIATTIIDLGLTAFECRRRGNAAATLPIHRHRWRLPRAFFQLLDHPGILGRQLRDRLYTDVLLHPWQIRIKIVIDQTSDQAAALQSPLIRVLVVSQIRWTKLLS